MKKRTVKNVITARTKWREGEWEDEPMTLMDIDLLKKYGLYVKLLYSHDYYMHLHEWQATEDLFIEFEIDRKHFYNVLYCLIALMHDFDDIWQQHIFEKSDQADENDLLTFIERAEKHIKAEPPFFLFLDDEIKSVLININGRTVEAPRQIKRLVRREVYKILEDKHVRGNTLKRTTKPKSETIKVLKHMAPFAKFLFGERVLKTKEQVYSFIERYLNWLPVTVSGPGGKQVRWLNFGTDPRSTIKKALQDYWE